MRKCLLLLFILLYPSVANAYTATFEEIAVGGDLDYYSNTTGFLNISDGFVIADHSASSWGTPHSPNNVLCATNTGSLEILLRAPLSAGGISSGDPVYATYFGVYFSTAPEALVSIDIYGHRPGSIFTTTIGGANEQWTNKYIYFNSPSGDIHRIRFTSLGSPSGYNESFCLDDLTITPVPEPSSILAILAGMAGISGFAWRRK